MDLTRWLQARAMPRPLLVAAPGGRVVRLAVERLTRERGWDAASAPADADLLIVCGVPDAALAEAVQLVWAQLPSPRAMADIPAADDVAGELDRARARLADRDVQRVDSAARACASDSATVGAPHEDTGDDPPGEHDMSQMPQMPDMPGGHDMHMRHGGEVAGLPMADRAPDRDGLTLDQLHVSLGPALADWPAGLAVHVTLQGDVVQSATVEVVGESRSPVPPWDGATAALDSLARLLGVCGWSTAARTARRLRDDQLAGAVDERELARFARRLRRSRTLRWATDGIGRLDERHGDLAGDATQRWRRWVDVVEGARPDGDPAGRARIALEVLPGLLEGEELAAARVLVASFDPDIDTWAGQP